MQRIEFNAGQIIFNQGDDSDRCYQIVSGKVEIRLGGASGGKVIETLGYGAVFGEMGIIDDSPRSATALATERTVCISYTPEEIIDLLESNPKEALDYIRTLIRRVRSTNARVTIRTMGQAD